MTNIPKSINFNFYKKVKYRKILSLYNSVSLEFTLKYK